MTTHNNVVDALKRLQFELQFQPGSQYDYSNTGYVVLADIIEKLTEQRHEDFIREHIFIPAGMRSSKVTSIAYNPEQDDNVAIGHTFSNRKKRYQRAYEDKKHKHLTWMKAIVGGSDIYTTAHDLEKLK